MKLVILAGLLITFPALLIALWFFGRPAMLPALASFAINMLPFLVVVWLMRGRKTNSDDLSH